MSPAATDDDVAGYMGSINKEWTMSRDNNLMLSRQLIDHLAQAVDCAWVKVGLRLTLHRGNVGDINDIFDLLERESEMRALQERHIENLVGRIRAAFTHTTARSVFVASGWSSLSLLSPALWRKWEKPALQAAVAAAHEMGGLIHHHFHGRCRKVLS